MGEYIDITKRPAAPRKATADVKSVIRPEVLTLSKLFTGDHAHDYRIGFLKDLSKKKGPWQKYWAFYQANHTGDISSMNKESRAFAEKLCDDVKKKYEEEMI